jgi:hypothetical protein
MIGKVEVVGGGGAMWDPRVGELAADRLRADRAAARQVEAVTAAVPDLTRGLRLRRSIGLLLLRAATRLLASAPAGAPVTVPR